MKVTTDLECDWTLDGAAQGRLKVGEVKNVRVSPGDYLVRATSTDGQDSWQTPVTVGQSGQKLLQIPLSSVRQARQEKEAAERKREEEHRQEEARKQEEIRKQEEARKREEERKQIEQRKQEEAREEARKREDARKQQQARKLEKEQKFEQEYHSTWTDSKTGLMWTTQENGRNVNWQQAVDYCRNLTLGDYSNWRLPTIEEIAGIYVQTQDVNGRQTKGGIRLRKYIWSSTPVPVPGQPGMQYTNQRWLFSFANGNRVKGFTATAFFSTGALCVRRSGE